MSEQSSSEPQTCARLIIVGFGNSYCGDDGVGPAAARLLHASFGREARVDLMELSSSALELIERLAGYDEAIILDALVDEDEPVGVVKPLELVEGRAISSLGCHTAGLGSALALARAMGMQVPSKVKLYGIVIRQPRVFSEILSEELADKLPAIVETVAAALLQAQGADASDA